jgi:hypothetical protein
VAVSGAVNKTNIDRRNRRKVVRDIGIESAVHVSQVGHFSGPVFDMRERERERANGAQFALVLYNSRCSVDTRTHVHCIHTPHFALA